jgi:4-hydroxy-3-methylbut-2-en-1-yl diphosphate reductase
LSWQEEVENMMASEFTSPMINTMKERMYTLSKGDLTIKLANKFGFCWGVERAVAMAYEARRHFPEEVRRKGVQTLSLHRPL